MQIIVDISAEQVDKLFTYRIPDDMELVRGQRVLVPFVPMKKEGFVKTKPSLCSSSQQPQLPQLLLPELLPIQLLPQPPQQHRSRMMIRIQQQLPPPIKPLLHIE